MEHRWGARVTVDLAVRISSGRLTVANGRAVNLSLSGAFITGAKSLRRLATLEVLFHSTHLKHKVTAYVTRRTAEGIGVEWCEFGPREIRDLLREASVDSAADRTRPRLIHHARGRRKLPPR